MERAEYLGLFKRLDDQVDDQTYWEAPKAFSCRAAERKFLALATDIQQVLGEKCSIEYSSQIQDASFHALLSVSKSCKLQEDYVVSLRVSNFGNLATLYDADDVVKPGCLDTFKDILKRHNYIYIPSWILREPYPGPKNIAIPNWATDIPNWGIRFFDWL